MNCSWDNDCKNKFFKIDKISQVKEVPLCRKHWYITNYGLSEYEASRR